MLRQSERDASPFPRKGERCLSIQAKGQSIPSGCREQPRFASGYQMQARADRSNETAIIQGLTYRSEFLGCPWVCEEHVAGVGHQPHCARKRFCARSSWPTTGVRNKSKKKKKSKCEANKKEIHSQDETRYGQCQKNGNMEWVRMMVSLVSVAAEALLLPITTVVGPRSGSQTVLVPRLL